MFVPLTSLNRRMKQALNQYRKFVIAWLYKLYLLPKKKGIILQLAWDAFSMKVEVLR